MMLSGQNWWKWWQWHQWWSSLLQSIQKMAIDHWNPVPTWEWHWFESRLQDSQTFCNMPRPHARDTTHVHGTNWLQHIVATRTIQLAPQADALYASLQCFWQIVLYCDNGEPLVTGWLPLDYSLLASKDFLLSAVASATTTAPQHCCHCLFIACLCCCTTSTAIAASWLLPCFPLSPVWSSSLLPLAMQRKLLTPPLPKTQFPFCWAWKLLL